jgi:hypothetical protein
MGRKAFLFATTDFDYFYMKCNCSTIFWCKNLENFLPQVPIDITQHFCVFLCIVKGVGIARFTISGPQARPSTTMRAVCGITTSMRSNSMRRPQFTVAHIMRASSAPIQMRAKPRAGKYHAGASQCTWLLGYATRWAGAIQEKEGGVSRSRSI